MSIKHNKKQTWRECAEMYERLWQSAHMKEQKWDKLVDLFKEEYPPRYHCES